MRGSLVLLLLAVVTSCTGEYFPDSDYMGNFQPKVTVCSMLCPDSTIKVELRWSKKFGDPTPFEPINGARVVIKEDDQTIFEATTVDGIAQKEIYPVAGKRYDLFVYLDDRPEISARTSIPQNSDIRYTTREKYLSMGDNFVSGRGYVLFDVSAIYPSDAIRSLWLRTRAIYEKSQRGYAYDMYTNNPFVDQVNAESDTREVQYRESNKVFSHRFLRVPRTSFLLLTPFTFSVDASWSDGEYVLDENGALDEWGNPVWNYIEEKMTYIDLVVTTPSDDYDKFCRSAYKHDASSSNMSPFINDIVSVYGNIKNGLGIFAGYNERAVRSKIVQPLEKEASTR